MLRDGTITRRTPAWVLVLAMVLAAAGCRCPASGDDTVEIDAEPFWDVAPPSPPSRAGMVWVPPGTLIAGTPPGQLPRIADQELPGVPTEMGGFFIDRFNHPAEPGAIPVTGMTQAEARTICERQEKRLCTELEWERACKGEDNNTYEYGNAYDASHCGMGSTDALAPNGVNTSCFTAFGVRDMHGSAWNWTSSAWGRGSDDSRVAVRGGNGVDGELIGRCAHARPQRPDRGDPHLGVRCCAGNVNQANVALDVIHGSELAFKPFDQELADQLEKLIPDELRERVAERPAADHFRVERLWMWRPIGNEELVIGGGCAHPPGHDACGIVIGRPRSDGVERIGFVTSEWWIPTVGEHDEPRSLYLYGGDIGGAYRKSVVYDYGRIREGEKWRKRGGGWVRLGR